MIARFPKWWLLYEVVKGIFLRFGVITLVIFSPLFTLFVLDSPYAHNTEYMIAICSWFLLIAPFAVNYLIAKNRKQKILSVLNEIRATGHFNPTKDSEGWLFWKSTYIGFDYNQGTIVYIRIYPGNVMDVIGFDAYSLTHTEVEGSKLRLYTKFASLPMIPIDTYAASNLADHIHGMNNKGYSYSFNFPEIVKQKRVKLETLAGMPVPDLI
ncbi:plasmid IncI1-type surface exclusion protein ExcA [Enterobacter sp. SECR19-1250]|uniref:plasmid IncI1-type surface exclusion protein ExcA n=1 Tax=Enterobacter sp. SECR19-1250 TaxID=2749084 RepID=UPI0015B445B3|nr:plasmid IncI1-type surface exclusion protein ExcA [Enterobacter sp. SECR19-1250]NWJ78828.1 plasmid IncI1-type surface exclusion protein ExcA [Enterobacter sp. SECR19-1250]